MFFYIAWIFVTWHEICVVYWICNFTLFQKRKEECRLIDSIKNRVVITGVGVVAPNGIGKDEFWSSLKKGVSGVSRITGFDVEQYPVRIAGEIKDFNPSKYIDAKKAKRMSRATRFAVVSAKMAKDDAGLVIEKEDPAQIGVVLGLSIQGLDIMERQYDLLLKNGPEGVNPFGVAGYTSNASVGHISVELGITGRTMVLSTGCSAGSNAIGYAFEMIRHGMVEIMIAGGADAPITPLGLSSFCAIRSLSTRNDEPRRASRPFEKNRDGYILGEGAGIFILENLDHALARSAKIYAEITGYACNSDAYSMYKVEPSGRQAAEAMVSAMKNADIKPEDVDYICAHGTSSLISDARETTAIKMSLNGNSGRIPVSSIKSMTGHPLGAAGGLQVAACLMAFNDGVIAPTINYDEPDPVCDLDYVPNEARAGRVNVALVNSLGIGGNNAVLVLKRFED